MEILNLINKERRVYGIASLRYNNNNYISQGTNLRANEITRYFAHYRPIEDCYYCTMILYSVTFFYIKCFTTITNDKKRSIIEVMEFKNIGGRNE